MSVGRLLATLKIGSLEKNICRSKKLPERGWAVSFPRRGKNLSGTSGVCSLSVKRHLDSGHAEVDMIALHLQGRFEISGSFASHLCAIYTHLPSRLGRVKAPESTKISLSERLAGLTILRRHNPKHGTGFWTIDTTHGQKSLSKSLLTRTSSRSCSTLGQAGLHLQFLQAKANPSSDTPRSA